MLQEELKSVGLVIAFLKSQGYDATSSDKGGKSRYLHYDITCSKNGSEERLIEVKERFMPSDKFPRYSKEGFIYEDTKYQFLKDKNGYYCNVVRVHGIPYIFIWYIGIGSTIKLNWTVRSCRATTSFANNNYVNKLISYVYPQDAQIIKYEDGEFSPIDYDKLIESLKCTEQK